MALRTALRVFVFLALFSGLNALEAQDWVKLSSGKMLRGECLEEKDDEIVFIDRKAAIHKIKRSDIKRLNRRAFKAPVKKKLEAIDLKDKDAIMEIVTWAAGEKKLKKDASRLALRILALDDQHAGARAQLGHIKILGTWYLDAKSANEALAEKMTADGYVPVADGWIKEPDLVRYEADPGAWMLTEGVLWRLIDDVMKERGFKKYEGVWYPKEEHDLVDKLALLEERTEEKAHAARVGSCEVFCVNGKESAQENAENIAKARAWFVKTFVKDEKKAAVLLERPTSRVYILTDVVGLNNFSREYKAQFKIDQNAAAFALKAGHLTWLGLGHAISTKHAIWKAQVVSQMGGDLSRWVWKPQKWEQPAWLWVACAHSAEFEVFGQARAHYIAQDKYGRKTEPPQLKGRNIRELKLAMRDLYRAKEAPTVRNLFNKSFNELTGDMNIMGILLMQYLLEFHEEGLLGFMTGEDKGNIKSHFTHYFKTSFETLNHDFMVWVRKP